MSAVVTTTGQSLTATLATTQPEYDTDAVLVCGWFKRNSEAESGPRHAVDLSCGYTANNGRRLGVAVQAGPVMTLFGGWGNSQASRSCGDAAEDAWQFFAARLTPNTASPSPAWNYWNGSPTGSSNSAGGAFNPDATDDLKVLTIGNRAYSPTAQTVWDGKVAEVSIWCPVDMDEANAICLELQTKTADSVVAASPIWYRSLKEDASGGTGAALTNNGSVTFDALDHPTFGGPVAPVFVTTSLPNGSAGVAYGENIEVSGSPAPTASVVAGDIPPWATIIDGGQPWVIEGSEEDVTPGVWNFTLEATNAAGSAQQAFSITVPNPGGGGGELPEVTTVTLVPASASVQTGSTVDLTVTVEDQDGDPISGLLGAVSSSAPGVATAVQLAVTDAFGQATIRVTGVTAGSAGIKATFDGEDSNTSTITVTAAAVAPTITSTSPLPPATVGVPYSYQFTAAGTGPITWSGTAPAGFSLSSTGLLTGTAAAAGSPSFAVTATNGQGSDVESFVLPIAAQPAPLPPVIYHIPSAPSPIIIAGEGVPGATIDVEIDSVPIPGAAVVDATGSWAYVHADLVGSHVVIARQTTGAGTSEWSDPRHFLVLHQEAHVGLGGKTHAQRPTMHPVPKQPDPAPEPAADEIAPALHVPFFRPKAWPGEK